MLLVFLLASRPWLLTKNYDVIEQANHSQVLGLAVTSLMVAMAMQLDFGG